MKFLKTAFLFVEQNILYHIKQKALSFLGRRFHSERELLIKLKSKSYDERLIKIVLNEMKVNSFINDQIFATHFVEEKLNKKHWGKIKCVRLYLVKEFLPPL